MPSTGSGTGTPVTGVLTPFEALPYFNAVWVWDNSAGVYINNTIAAQTATGAAFTILEDPNDFVYLGAPNRFDLGAFFLGVVGALGALTWSYYRSGAVWTQTVPNLGYDFTVNGAESFDRLVNWTTLAFSAGTPHAPAPPDTDARYWIRISAASVTTAPTVQRIISRPYAAYCTPTDVSQLLQLSVDFSSTTTPTRARVEEMIRVAQSTIDYKTGHSWRINYQANEEHHFNIAGFKLLRQDTRSTTRLQIWNGSEYDTKVEGRGNDYFLVPETGIVYFARYFLLPARLQSFTAPWPYGWGEYEAPVRVSYFYGSDVHTDDRRGGIVFDITQKLVAIDVFQSHDYGILAVSGADKVNLSQKIENWKQEVEDKLESLRSWQVF